MNVYETQYAKYEQISLQEYSDYSGLIEAVRGAMVSRNGDPVANAVVILGFSGNGKATWIKKFVQENPSYEVLSMDSVFKSLGENPEPSVGVREFGRKLKEICSEGKNVIIDGNFLNLLTRSVLLDSLNTYNYQVNLVDITSSIGDTLPYRILDRTAAELGYRITKENLQDVLKSKEFHMCRREIMDFYLHERRKSNFDEQLQYDVLQLGVDHLFTKDTPLGEIARLGNSK